jgi:transposase
MTVPQETEVNIVRLHYGEHWPVGTIAAQLGIHPDVVKRVLQYKRANEPTAPRQSVITPFTEFIGQTLEQYPKLRATRLYDMLVPRGYLGSLRTLREYVATTRPEPKTEAYLRLELLAGEQAQIDWAHVARMRVDGGERSLWVFVMVLSHSRAMWAELVFDMSVESLCRSLTRAAGYFGGVTRQWLFDNPKTVVIERYGDAVRFHPVLLGLCAHFRVQPRLCAVAMPEHKGRVERAIRYLRERFFAGRHIRQHRAGQPRAADVPRRDRAAPAASPQGGRHRRRRVRRRALAAARVARPAAVHRVRAAGRRRQDRLRTVRHQPLLGAARVRRSDPHARVR